MKIKSLMQQHHTLVPVEIELSLSPGLPQLIVIGLPDAVIKESVLRIKSALKQQGFEWPRAQQILVHLKPSHLKKSSLGLDLAIAGALLWETEQLPRPPGDLILYGELSLKGDVLAPSDVDRAGEAIKSSGHLITGPSANLDFDSWQVRTLRELKNPRSITSAVSKPTFKRPASRYTHYPLLQAQAMKIIAAGEHNALIAGPPGCGKTSLAEDIPSLIEEPSLAQWNQQQQWALHFRQKLEWRAVVQAHHSTPALSMIGGGQQLKPGEITRAHGGVLIMDELLEFVPRVQEALRECVESGEITLARTGGVAVYPADFLLIGTTNLCNCGLLTFHAEDACRCRSTKRDAYLARLSGPFMDRFAIFKIIRSVDRADEQIPIESIAGAVGSAIQFRKARGQLKPNSKLGFEELSKRGGIGGDHITGSRRRHLSLLQIARTLADLESSQMITHSHLKEARRWAQEDFDKLQAVPARSIRYDDQFAKVESRIRSAVTEKRDYEDIGR